MNRIVKLLLGPTLLLLSIALLPLGTEQNTTLGIIAWMISWWITQPIPIGATALLPMVLFPAFGIIDLKSVSQNYGHPIIFLFFGGFVLGLAIEKWNLHRRFALNILKISGSKPNRIIIGSMAATAIMSMWISNTASTLMMLPIGLSIVVLLEPKLESAKAKRNFSTSLLLGLAFAANIGGMATLIGTPPNLVLAAFSSESLGININFSDWFMMALPLVIILFFVAYYVNTRMVFPTPRQAVSGFKDMIREEIEKLGKLSSGERRVFIVFLATAFFWILRTPISKIPGMDFLNDSIIAISSAVVLFIVTEKNGKPILEWKDTQKLPWDILLLFGGGLAIAMVMKTSGLVESLGDLLQDSNNLPWFLIILILVALSIFITEGMSNLALVTIFVPVVFTLAPLIGGDPIQLAIPVTLAASCAFMLPIATPPNAIVFSSHKIKMQDMIVAGFVMNIVCMILISVWAYFVVPIVF